MSTNDNTIRVLIVDDHDIVRQGLRRVLDNDSLIQVVGEARNGRESVKMISQISPEVVVMDLKLPDMDGITATREIKKQHPDIHVIMLTMFADEYIEEAIEAGVSGYIIKDADSSNIVRAIHKTRQGLNTISPELNKNLVKAFLKANNKEDFSLSKRQKDILSLMCEGAKSQEVCSRLGISVSTEKRELRNIYNILDVNCRAHAISVAIRQGLIKNIGD